MEIRLVHPRKSLSTGPDPSGGPRGTVEGVEGTEVDEVGVQSLLVSKERRRRGKQLTIQSGEWDDLRPYLIP